MSEIFSRPIGSRFMCKDVELEVVENTHGVENGCGRLNEMLGDACYFFKKKCWEDDYLSCRGSCISLHRDDHKDVYFKEVES